MVVRILLVLTAFTVLYGCGQASSPDEEQTAEEKESEYTPSPAPTDYVNPTASATADQLEYGDPVELIGIPWSEPQRIDYEGRQVVVVVFQYAEGQGAEEGS